MAVVSQQAAVWSHPAARARPILTTVARRRLHEVHQHGAPLLLRRLLRLLCCRRLFSRLWWAAAGAAALLAHQLRHAPLADRLQLWVVSLLIGETK